MSAFEIVLTALSGACIFGAGVLMGAFVVIRTIVSSMESDGSVDGGKEE